MDLSPLSQAIPSFGSPTLEGLEINGTPQDGQRIGGSSKRQFVQFYKKRIAEPCAEEVAFDEKTGATRVLKTGVKIVEREMVRVVTPGDKNEVDDFAQDFHKREYWHQYKAFRDGKGIPIGTPLEECQYIAPSICTELRYLGVQTEEQLADASDLLCERIAEGHSLREFARTNCKVKNDNAASGQVNLLRVELEKERQARAEMMAEFEALKAKINGSTDVEPKKTGRPKKIDLEA